MSQFVSFLSLQAETLQIPASGKPSRQSCCLQAYVYGGLFPKQPPRSGIIFIKKILLLQCTWAGKAPSLCSPSPKRSSAIPSHDPQVPGLEVAYIFLQIPQLQPAWNQLEIKAEETLHAQAWLQWWCWVGSQPFPILLQSLWRAPVQLP